MQPVDQPVANLSIQPKTVDVGEPFIVSWTSVGMKPDLPCILSGAGKEVARGVSGTRQVTVPFATTTQYLLVCTSAAGARIEVRESAVVK